MKTILLFALFSILSMIGLNAQVYYIKAGNTFALINHDGTISLDDKSATRFTVQTSDKTTYLIMEKHSSRYLVHDLNQSHQIQLALEGGPGSYFGFVNNTAYGGWLIYRTFDDGKNYYLVNSSGQLRWLSSYHNSMPAVLIEDKTASYTQPSRQTDRQENWGNAKRTPEPRTKASTDHRIRWPEGKKKATKQKEENKTGKKPHGEGRPAREPENRPKPSYGSLNIDCTSSNPCGSFDLVVKIEGDRYSNTIVFKDNGDVFTCGEIPVGQYRVNVLCNCGKCDMALPAAKTAVVSPNKTTTLKFDM